MSSRTKTSRHKETTPPSLTTSPNQPTGLSMLSNKEIRPTTAPTSPHAVATAHLRSSEVEATTAAQL